MRQVSLVGAVDEEVGDYFPEFISMLEESPFLEVSMFIMPVYVNAISASESLSNFSLCMAMSHYVTHSFSPCVYTADSALGNVLQSAAAEPH